MSSVVEAINILTNRKSEKLFGEICVKKLKELKILLLMQAFVLNN